MILHGEYLQEDAFEPDVLVYDPTQRCLEVAIINDDYQLLENSTRFSLAHLSPALSSLKYKLPPTTPYIYMAPLTMQM